MNPLNLQPVGARRLPRSKVKIVTGKRFSRVTILSFVLGALAVVSFPLLWYTRRPPPAPEVAVEDSRMWVWKCDAGHTFRAGFRKPTSPCLRCDKPAFPIGWYTCPVHGSFEVAAHLVRGDNGKMVVSKVRLTGRRWEDEQELECPRCDRKLAYKGRDPLERAIRSSKPDGG